MAVRTAKFGYFMILIAGCLWGLIGWFTTGLSAYGFDSSVIACMRLSFGVLALVPVMLAVGGTKLFFIDFKGLLFALALGVFGQAFFNIAYAEAITQVGMSVAAVLLYTSPGFVTIMSVMFFNEKIGSKKILALLVNVIGCILTVTGGHFDIAGLPLGGIVNGIASGFFYASMTVISTMGLKNYHPLSILFYGLLFGAVGIGIITQPWLHMTGVWSVQSLLLAVGFGIVPTVISYCFYMKGLTYDLETSKVPIIASVETIVAAVIGIFILGESAEVVKIMGIGCVFASIAVMSLSPSYIMISKRKRLRWYVKVNHAAHQFKF